MPIVARYGVTSARSWRGRYHPYRNSHRALAGTVGALAGILLAVLLLTGCVGIVDDYAKTAIGLGQNATGNTIRTLAQKHELEAAAYAASYCGQPRIGAVERRYRDPVHLHARLAMCEIEREIGFQP